MTILQQMQSDMVLQYLGHQSINPSPHRCQQHKDVGTVMVFCSQRTFYSVYLPTNSLHPIQ